MDPIRHGLIGALLAVLLVVRQRYGLVAAAVLVAASMAPECGLSICSSFW